MPRTPTTSGPTAGHRPSLRLLALGVILTLGLGLGLTGCAEDTAPAASESPSPSAASGTSPSESATESVAPEGQVIDITVEGDTVVPSGERVDASVGEEIILRVTADAPGEIHVHATPEQELRYEPGTTDLPLTIDQPGLVDVESHTLDMVIVQLEVR